MSAGRWDRTLPERIDVVRGKLMRMAEDPFCLERTRAAVEEELRALEREQEEVDRAHQEARQLNLF